MIICWSQYIWLDLPERGSRRFARVWPKINHRPQWACQAQLSHQRKKRTGKNTMMEENKRRKREKNNACTLSINIGYFGKRKSWCMVEFHFRRRHLFINLAKWFSKTSTSWSEANDLKLLLLVQNDPLQNISRGLLKHVAGVLKT